jgi:transcriptional regulator with XRE-family HTH domain
MDLGMNLKRLRKSSGLTQDEVAKKLGITQSAYAHYENGIRKVEAEKIPTIAQILGVEIADIYAGHKPKEPLRQEVKRPHKNRRSAQIQELFAKLPVEQQRALFKMIQASVK